MSHFAKIENGVVTQVIGAEQDVIDTGLFGDPSIWVQTSYNTIGGIHYGQDGQPDGGVALRKNYASIGYAYDAQADAFYDPNQPFPSWTFDRNTFLWTAPILCPNDGKNYYWDETLQNWKIWE